MEKLKLPSDYDDLGVSQENDEYIFKIKQIKEEPSGLICKLAASLARQESKLETSYCKRVSHHASNLQQACCDKHIANYSKKYADEPQTRNPDNPLPKPVVYTTQPEGLRLRKTDCVTERLQLLFSSGFGNPLRLCSYVGRSYFHQNRGKVQNGRVMFTFTERDLTKNSGNAII
ncbi:hypothetical protein AVEN_207932-1 [Araneus ventricosus]|uniref:Uncharacterized protein n=1 Tax=Araneus ventricosus TaxID=182803 RepID=A0A4Y2V286_ARAVE|nr:hypothetical protein AVEN_207932-1 [Araneus ventricosus]